MANYKKITESTGRIDLVEIPVTCFQRTGITAFGDGNVKPAYVCVVIDVLIVDHQTQDERINNPLKNKDLRKTASKNNKSGRDKMKNDSQLSLNDMLLSMP
jgi:hypothetical protein